MLLDREIPEKMNYSTSSNSLAEGRAEASLCVQYATNSFNSCDLSGICIHMLTLGRPQIWATYLSEGRDRVGGISPSAIINNARNGSSSFGIVFVTTAHEDATYIKGWRPFSHFDGRNAQSPNIYGCAI